MPGLTKENITLGASYHDVATGYSGRCTAYAIYDTGEISLYLANIDSTGRPIETWVNIERLIFLK